MTDQFDAPAVLDQAAGVPLIEPSVVLPDGAPVPPAPSITASDLVVAQGGVDAAFKAINSQPKERIRVLKAMGPQTVVINGARFNIPANVSLEVPKQVADILRESERI